LTCNGRTKRKQARDFQERRALFEYDSVQSLRLRGSIDVGPAATQTPINAARSLAAASWETTQEISCELKLSLPLTFAIRYRFSEANVPPAIPFKSASSDALVVGPRYILTMRCD
jgi:hypothetical protein